MSKRPDDQNLLDIIEAINRINDYTRNMTTDLFWEDTKTQDAVVRNLEIIGEAAKNISDELKIKNPAIPWKTLAGVRDRLIHHYFGINLDIVWSIVRDDLPTLLNKIKEIAT